MRSKYRFKNLTNGVNFNTRYTHSKRV